LSCIAGRRKPSAAHEIVHKFRVVVLHAERMSKIASRARHKSSHFTRELIDLVAAKLIELDTP
jgi:hypothetical protein